MSSSLFAIGLILGAQTSEALDLSAKGLRLLAQGDPEQAEPFLAKAHSLVPDDFVIARDLAAARFRSGDHRGALAAIDRAIDLGDPDPEARELRAVILAALG